MKFLACPRKNLHLSRDSARSENMSGQVRGVSEGGTIAPPLFGRIEGADGSSAAPV